MYVTVGPVLSALLSVSYTYFLALFVLARDEVHITGRNCLVVIPAPDCFGSGLGRACAVPWLPAGRG